MVHSASLDQQYLENGTILEKSQNEMERLYLVWL